MNIHVHHRYYTRMRAAASRLRRNQEQPLARVLNLMLPKADPEQARADTVSLETPYHLGIIVTEHFANADHETAASMLENQDSSIMANCHATMMSSMWTYFQQPSEYHPDFYADLAAEAQRITWVGSPFVPAIRWQLPDGSAFVTYGSQIMPAVHRDRIDAIADDYLAAAHKSMRLIAMRGRTIGNHRGNVPLAPHPAFAPASDGILSHQAALPLDFAFCWCQYRHTDRDDPNRVRP